MRRFVFAIPVFLLGAGACAAATGPAPVNPCPNAQPVPAALQAPSSLPPGEPFDFEKQLRAYLGTLAYRSLGWCEDVWARDTGPFLDGSSYGTHPVVRIYYSKQVSDWLVGGRKGQIPDGAVIIKEQYDTPPAQPYWNLYGGKPLGCPNDWTFMIKNSKASKDGWFWGEVWYNASTPMKFNDPFQYPNSGYGLYCLRCHASAEKEYTFSTLDNIKNAAGVNGNAWPLTYRVDNSWMNDGWRQKYTLPGKCGDAGPPSGPGMVTHGKNMVLAALKTQGAGLAGAAVPPTIQTFPPEPWDKKVSGPDRPPPYITSDQCTGCHSAIQEGGFGPNMFISPNVNFSQYGEWRWSPMGLAGRDPVFFAQLESEFASFPDPMQKQNITNICMNCHGAMGLKTYYLDHGQDPNHPPLTGKVLFNSDWVFLRDSKDANFQYGGLARDGVSCAVCHHMAPPPDPGLDWFLNHYINGDYKENDPARFNGPFETADITQYPMNNALGIKPQGSDFIKNPRLCGSCHTINLPVMDSPTPGKMSIEQATYLEWLNSDFQTEYGRGTKAQTCQECHMPTSYRNAVSGIKVDNLESRMAIVQDITYPAAAHTAKPEDLNVRYRVDGFHRHELLGLNGILLEMALQFTDAYNANPILGVRLADYMSGLTTDLPNAIANVVQQAGYKTAQLNIPQVSVSNGTLTADVEVVNLTGHRLPSGVGFRRAFIECVVYQDGKPIFSSGLTNANGEIVDGAGQALPTEFFVNGQYQPHFDVNHPITASSQAQIFEELTQDAQKNFTTSFLKRDAIIKDNRLLATGWKKAGPAGSHIPEYFLESTWPVAVGNDPSYASGSGTSRVRYSVQVPKGVEASRFQVKAKLQYQSTPPYYFADRFQTKSAAAERLRYLKNNLPLGDTAFASWKLLLCSNVRQGK